MERSTENKFHSFNLPSSYQAGLRKIADQQRMAKLLQEQAQAPTERFSYKGIEAHTPATAGLAKILQGLTGTYLQGKVRDEEEALGKKYQTESSDLLRQAFDAGSGTPAVAGKFVPGAEEVFDEELGLDQISPAKDAQIVGGTAAVQGDPQRMAQLLMRNPSPDIQKMGAEQMRKNMESQAFMNAGMGTGAPVAGEMPAGTFGGLAGGQPMAVWLRIDPSGGLYTKQLATDKQNREENNLAQEKLRQQINEWNGLSAAQQEQLKALGITSAIALADARAKGLNVSLPPSTGVPAAQSSTTPPPVVPAAQSSTTPPPGAAPLGSPPMQDAAPPGSPPRQDAAPTTPPADSDLSPNQRREARAKLVADRPAQTASAQTSLQNIDRLINVTRELLKHPGLDRIVGKFNQYSLGDVTDDALNARALQGTLVKQSAVAALQAMRDASKAGGAVGNVTEKEWPILEQQMAALDSAQTTEAYKTALTNLLAQLSASSNRVRNAYTETYGKLDYEKAPYREQNPLEQPKVGAVRRIR